MTGKEIREASKELKMKVLEGMWGNLDCVLRVMRHNQRGIEWRKGVVCSDGNAKKECCGPVGRMEGREQK